MLGRSLLDGEDATWSNRGLRRCLALDPSGPAAADLHPASTPAGELEQASRDSRGRKVLETAIRPIA